MSRATTPRLCGAEYLRDYKILATFEDGKTGVIDLEPELRGGVFEPLRDIGLFRRFRFDPELDTIVWPTGADLAPEYLYENAVIGELRPVVESAVEQPFFPVSKVRVRASDTGHVFRRHWAVVSDDRREIFSIVTEDYRLVSNLRAYELGRRAFALVFGKDALAGLRLFHVTMPATRSWAHSDLTAEGLDFAPMGEDRWLPFLRVTNSYNRSRALAFTVGVCRWICTNGMIFGEQSLKLKVSHATEVNLERRLVEAFGHRRFDVAGCRDKLEELTRLSVPQERFLAGVLEILEAKPPADLPRNAARQDGWLRLGPHLCGLGEKYRKELGDTAYALVNAASEYAGDTKAPLMSPARVDAPQFRCGSWVDRVLERYGPSLASGTVVHIKPGSMRAARRLTDWQRDWNVIEAVDRRGMPEPFAGARWWKFDFRTHTPASLDTPWSGIENEQEQLSPEQWLLRFMEAQVDCVAITDHNTSDWIDRLKNAYTRLDSDRPAGFRPLCLFPGVELSVNGGFHLLAVFDRDATGRSVSDLLARVEYQGTPGRCDGVTRKAAVEVVDIVADLGALAIPAHVDQQNGLLQSKGDTGELALDTNTVGQVIRRPEVLAAEVVSRDWVEHQICRDSGCAWTAVVGSDCHNFRRGVQPGERFTWVKMGQPSIEGLRLALLDGAPLSVRRSDLEDGDPIAQPRLAIEALRVGNARRAGRGESLQVRFSPWMSVIVGGRGTGKSTLVEMLRLGLDRAGELPAGLRDDFEQFARVAVSRDDQGALLDDTTIGVIYRKDNGRFRIRWCRGDASIEERSGADAWSPSPGDVQGRFPARILSQKQIFALAADPDALVRLVDDALPAEHAEHDRRRQRMETRYLSLRGQIRELEARLGDRSRVEGELADVKRQLAAFEEGGHQALLVEFQRFRRQERAIRSRREEMDDAVKRLRGTAAEIEPTDVREEEFPPKSAAAAEVLGLVRALAERQNEMARRLIEMADEAAAFLEQWRARANASEWVTAAGANREAYDALIARLAKEGVADPTSYGSLVQRRHALEREIHDIETLRARVEQLKVQSAGVLGDIENDRTEMSRARMAFLEGVLAGNRFVAMAVIPFGRDARAAEPAFRRRLGRQDAHLQQDILAADGDSGILTDLYSSLPADFDARVAAVRKRVTAVKRDVAAIAAGGNVEGRTKWFHNHVQALSPEQVDRFMCWWPEDGLQVQYRRSDADRLVPIEQGSPGQKSAAILAFLLCHGDEPIVLDQPEDDLDNHLIYDLVVQQVRAGKQRRQVIVATHNPNIVVNGDAEMVIAMDHRAGQCRMLDQGSGCLQEPGVREEICRVMEGGRQAFERRYRRLLEDARHA